MCSWFQYYMAATACALVVAPFLALWLRPLPDRGWTLARVAALYGMALLDRWLAGCGLLTGPATLRNPILLLLLALLAWSALRSQLGYRVSAWFRAWIRTRAHGLVAFEALHFTAYLLILQLFTVDSTLQQTERPMDAALFAAEAQAFTFPTIDPWLSGFALPYYSLGHRAVAWPLPFSGFDPASAYPAAFALVGAAALAGLTSLAVGLSQRMAPDRLLRSSLWKPLSLAALGLLVTNPIACRDGWNRLVASETVVSEAPWWWRSSRTVHDERTSNDSGERVHEFLLFTLRTGDLHAHLLALPLGLLAIATALAGTRTRRLSRLLPVWTALVAATALGHPWDLPRLMALFVGSQLLRWMRDRGTPRQLLLEFGYVLAWGTLALLPGAPILFDPPWTGVRFGNSRSDWSEFFTVWGALLPGWLLIFLASRRARAGCPELGLLWGCGVLLAAVPEVIYLVDSHGSRFNTFFKLNFSAWPLLATTAVAATIGTAGCRKLALLRGSSWIALASGLPYLAGLGADAWQKATPFPPDPKEELARHDPAVAEALDWIRAVIPLNDAVVQPAGVSYQFQTVQVSIFTGRPHPLGWLGHELQWRGLRAQTELKRRQELLEHLYQHASGDAIVATLVQLRSRWVWVGPEERSRFPNVEARFAGVLRQRFRNPGVTIWELGP